MKPLLHRLKRRFVNLLSSSDPKSEYSPISSYSQQGEDALILCLLQGKQNGFYVDIGAHHPLRYSNTHLFYQRGWRGINIDPCPGMMRAFRLHRPRDISLEFAVAAHAGTLTYHSFSDPALNTFDEVTAQQYLASGFFRLLERYPIMTKPLAEILQSHLPVNTLIDFMSVDVEGLDEIVLRSNDWNRFRPRLVLCEDSTSFTLEQVLASPLSKYLQEVDYVPISKLVHTIIFCDRVRAKGTFTVSVA